MGASDVYIDARSGVLVETRLCGYPADHDLALIDQDQHLVTWEDGSNCYVYEVLHPGGPSGISPMITATSSACTGRMG
jgi:hypothetical protein